MSDVAHVTGPSACTCKRASGGAAETRRTQVCVSRQRIWDCSEEGAAGVRVCSGGLSPTACRAEALRTARGRPERPGLTGNGGKRRDGWGRWMIAIEDEGCAVGVMPARQEDLLPRNLFISGQRAQKPVRRCGLCCRGKSLAWWRVELERAGGGLGLVMGTPLGRAASSCHEAGGSLRITTARRWWFGRVDPAAPTRARIPAARIPGPDGAAARQAGARTADGAGAAISPGQVGSHAAAAAAKTAMAPRSGGRLLQLHPV